MGMAGDGYAIGTKWGLCFTGRWVWELKNRIDLDWMHMFDSAATRFLSSSAHVLPPQSFQLEGSPVCVTELEPQPIRVSPMAGMRQRLMSAEQLSVMLQQTPTRLALVDVREPWEAVDNPLPGCRVYPLGILLRDAVDGLLQQQLGDRLLVAVCNIGYRSGASNVQYILFRC
jgi:rhodanese-related sulfurtransferase